MRDENEPEIIAALEAIGCTVWPLHTPVDLLVGRGAVNILMEVKNPAKPKSSRKKTKLQKEFFASWNGQVRIVETAEEAIKLVTELTVKNALPRGRTDKKCWNCGQYPETCICDTL